MRGATCTSLLIALLGLGIVSCWGGDDEGVKLPELAPFDEELSLRLTAIAVKASELRGLDVNEEIEQGTLTREQIEEHSRLSADKVREEDAEEMEALNAAFRLLRMIGPDDDLLEVFTSFQGSVLGFYSLEDQKLVLVSGTEGPISVWDELTLVHEYVHSFQDGSFDLEKLFERADKEEEDKANTEYGVTIDALIEGDAELAADLYVEELPPERLQELYSPPASGAGDAPELPPAMERYLYFPYWYGAEFVNYLYDKGGWEEVNEAYQELPKTTEQILHPEKYVIGEGAVELAIRDLSGDLGDDWEQQMDIVFGEFDVYNWLLSTLEYDPFATIAAEGWGGGRIAVYSNDSDPDRVVVQISLMWDDTDEALEFYTAFAEVVSIVDPEPTVPDVSGQIVSWQDEGQAGEAWIQRTSFNMVLASRASDADAAAEALDRPDRILETDYILR